MVRAIKLYNYGGFIPLNCYEPAPNSYVTCLVDAINSFAREFSNKVHSFNESNYENLDCKRYGVSVFPLIESYIDETVKSLFKKFVEKEFICKEITSVRSIVLIFAGDNFSFSSYIKLGPDKAKYEIDKAINEIAETKLTNVINAEELFSVNHALVIIYDFITRVELIGAINNLVDACKPGDSIDARGNYSLLSLVKDHLDQPLREYFASLLFDIHYVIDKLEVNRINSRILSNNFSFSKFIADGIKQDGSCRYGTAEQNIKETNYLVSSIRRDYIELNKENHGFKYRQRLYTSSNVLGGLIVLISSIKNARSEHRTDDGFNRVKRKKNHDGIFCELCWRPLGASYIQMLNYGEHENWNRQKISWYIYDELKCLNSKITNKKLFEAFDAFVQALSIKVKFKLSLPIFVELIRENIDAPLKNYFLSLDKKPLKSGVKFIISYFSFSERFAPGMWSLSEVSEHILDAIWEIVNCEKCSTAGSVQKNEWLFQLKVVLESLYDVVTIPELYPEIFDDMATEINNNARFCNIHLPSIPSGEYYSDKKYKAAFEEKIALLISINKEGVLNLRGEAIRKMAYMICRPSNNSNAKIIRKYSKIGFTPKQLTEKFGFSKQSISKALKRRAF